MSDAEARDAIGAQVDEFVKRVAYEASSLDLLGLKARVLGLLGPDPAGFDALIETYGRLTFQIGADTYWGTTGGPSPSMVPSDHRVANEVTAAANLVDDWTGDAAGAFRDPFALAFQADGATAIQQSRLITSLLLATEAQREVYVRARTDAKALFEAADAALDSLDDFSTNTVPLVLTIIAAVATIAATPSGVGWVMVASTSSTFSGILTTQANAPKERTFDPSGRYEIACQLFDLVAELEADVAASEGAVRSSVQGITAAMDPASVSGRALIGPSVTDPGGHDPITYAPGGTGSLPGSYTDEFVPPSATE